MPAGSGGGPASGRSGPRWGPAGPRRPAGRAGGGPDGWSRSREPASLTVPKPSPAQRTRHAIPASARPGQGRADKHSSTGQAPRGRGRRRAPRRDSPRPGAAARARCAACPGQADRQGQRRASGPGPGARRSGPSARGEERRRRERHVAAGDRRVREDLGDHRTRAPRRSAPRPAPRLRRRPRRPPAAAPGPSAIATQRAGQQDAGPPRTRTRIARSGPSLVGVRQRPACSQGQVRGQGVEDVGQPGRPSSHIAQVVARHPVVEEWTRWVDSSDVIESVAATRAQPAPKTTRIRARPRPMTTRRPLGVRRGDGLVAACGEGSGTGRGARAEARSCRRAGKLIVACPP